MRPCDGQASKQANNLDYSAAKSSQMLFSWIWRAASDMIVMYIHSKRPIHSTVTCNTLSLWSTWFLRVTPMASWASFSFLTCMACANQVCYSILGLGIVYICKGRYEMAALLPLDQQLCNLWLTSRRSELNMVIGMLESLRYIKTVHVYEAHPKLKLRPHHILKLVWVQQFTILISTLLQSCFHPKREKIGGCINILADFQGSLVHFIIF